MGLHVHTMKRRTNGSGELQVGTSCQHEIKSRHTHRRRPAVHARTQPLDRLSIDDARIAKMLSWHYNWCERWDGDCAQCYPERPTNGRSPVYKRQTRTRVHRSKHWWAVRGISLYSLAVLSGSGTMRITVCKSCIISFSDFRVELTILNSRFRIRIFDATFPLVYTYKKLQQKIASNALFFCNL